MNQEYKPKRRISGLSREQQKTAEDRAEDLAYNINHAIASTVTDVIEPEVNKFIQNDLINYSPAWTKPYLTKMKLHDNHGHVPITRGKALLAELVGDFGSVPVAVAAQRYAPEAMQVVEDALEPIVGKAFKNSAIKATNRWAEQYGIAYNSKAYKQHVEEIYDHEISHLPQAVLWTFSSIAINVLTQRAVGVTKPWRSMIAGKAGSVMLVSGAILSARMFSPKFTRTLDKWTTKNIVAPSTRHVGKVMGISEEAIENVLEEQNDVKPANWEQRTKKQTASQNLSIGPLYPILGQ